MTEESQLKDDQALWTAIQQDSELAFATLYERYWSILYSNAYNYLKDKDACMDIVHDIFISIWKKRHEVEIVSFKHYLTQSTRYQIYKKLESNNKSKVVQLEEWRENSENVISNEGEEKILYRDLEQKLDVLMENLPKRCREIFILSRRQNLSNVEIAEKLNISKRTVENQLTYALQHLRASLGDVTLGIFAFYLFYIK
jgi:RNA polymerase sigma-70 factor (family 1)